jgi:hypothetical protein
MPIYLYTAYIDLSKLQVPNVKYHLRPSGRQVHILVGHGYSLMVALGC